MRPATGQLWRRPGIGIVFVHGVSTGIKDGIERVIYSTSFSGEQLWDAPLKDWTGEKSNGGFARPSPEEEAEILAFVRKEDR